MAWIFNRGIWVRLIALVLGCCTLNACQPLGGVASVREEPTHFLDLIAFFDVDTTHSFRAVHPLVASPEMRNFIAEDIRKIKSKRVRVNALMDKLGKNGYYSDNYNAGLTQSASETFAAREGNCLSYTHMFIALAREAGLNAQYELVEAPPTFSATEGVLEHQVHIRARVVLPSRLYRERFISVDFNLGNVREYEGELISDEYALSLHYANDAVQYWREGKDAEAFVRIVKAISLAPRHSDHWVNLATFYNRRGNLAEALHINRYALYLDPGHIVALASVVQNAQGDEFHRAKSQLERHRAKNPYYQFALAQLADHHGHLEDALRFVDHSLRLNKRNHEFFELRGTILTKLELYTEAKDSFSNALDFATNDQEKERYRNALRKVERLIQENA